LVAYATRKEEVITLRDRCFSTAIVLVRSTAPAKRRITGRARGSAT